jgi:hypothetical protein
MSPSDPVEIVAQSVKGDLVGPGEPAFERPDDKGRWPVLGEAQDQIATAVERSQHFSENIAGAIGRRADSARDVAMGADRGPGQLGHSPATAWVFGPGSTRAGVASPRRVRACRIASSRVGHARTARRSGRFPDPRGWSRGAFAGAARGFPYWARCSVRRLLSRVAWRRSFAAGRGAQAGGDAAPLMVVFFGLPGGRRDCLPGRSCLRAPSARRRAAAARRRSRCRRSG